MPIKPETEVSMTSKAMPGLTPGLLPPVTAVSYTHLSRALKLFARALEPPCKGSVVGLVDIAEILILFVFV